MEGWRENRKGSALSTSPDPAAMEDERCFRSRRILEHTMLVRRFLRDVRNVGTGIRVFVRYKLTALLGRNLVSNIILFFKMYENI